MASRHLPSNHSTRSRIAAATVAIAACALAWLPGAMAGQVTVAWDPDTGAAVAGYKVYWGTVSRNYSWYADTSTQTNYTVPSLTPGATYYIAATAYDGTRNESGFSNEVLYTVPSACTFATTPAGQSFGAGGGTGSVSVTAGSGCSWTASNPASWVTITSGASGTGNGTVNYSAAPNTTTVSRTAGLTVAGTVVTITQAAATATYSLSLSTSGSGSIGTNPPGSTFAAGTPVTLTALPASGSTFTGWSGSCSGTASTCSVVMNSSLTVQASFAQAQPSYTLGVAKSGSGGGNVSIMPSGTSFPQGTSVTLTAKAQGNSIFAGWSGACSGTSNTCTVFMNGNASVTATFDSKRLVTR